MVRAHGIEWIVGARRFHYRMIMKIFTPINLTHLFALELATSLDAIYPSSRKKLSHYKILAELGRGGILNQTHLSIAFCTECETH